MATRTWAAQVAEGDEVLGLFVFYFAGRGVVGDGMK